MVENNFNKTSYFFESKNCEEVNLIAKKLSSILEIGDILLLKGSIGSGKSFFARSLINEYFRIFKIIEDIPSPTFSLIQTYDNIKPKVCHVDLYRMLYNSELEEMGLDYIYDDFLTIIEWPERLSKKYLEKFIQIEFMYSQKIAEERHLKISIVGIKRKNIFSCINELKKDFGGHI